MLCQGMSTLARLAQLAICPTPPASSSSHASLADGKVIPTADSLALFAASFCRSEPYDPYIPGSNPNQPGGGPGPSGGGSGGAKANDKTAKIQQQIDDTVGIMRENITKVAERGERLDALQDKTGEFAAGLVHRDLRCLVQRRLRTWMLRVAEGSCHERALTRGHALPQTRSPRARKASAVAPTGSASRWCVRCVFFFLWEQY